MNTPSKLNNILLLAKRKKHYLAFICVGLEIRAPPEFYTRLRHLLERSKRLTTADGILLGEDPEKTSRVLIENFDPTQALIALFERPVPRRTMLLELLAERFPKDIQPVVYGLVQNPEASRLAFFSERLNRSIADLI